MRETDISQYVEKNEPSDPNLPPEKGPVGTFFKSLLKMLLTILMVFVTAFVIIGVSLIVYIAGISAEPTGINLKAKELNQTSFIYVKDEKTGEFKEYQTLYASENRIWISFDNIPQSMKDAMVAIEDKRFYDHHGVDWTRTFGAFLSLATGTDNYGGSTLTQQLIKNIKDDNDVSLTRKIREIVTALKLEHEYTKDQILEAYLNVVNFGSNCQGCETAAQTYFGKSISDCSIAECAAIAGITQNPSKWDPLIYPENNKIRRETVLEEMYNQGKITEEEYNQAMKESETMTFVDPYENDEKDDDEEETSTRNWYIEQLVQDLKRDLSKYYNISQDAAEDMILTEGLKVYSAMDVNMQNFIEQAAINIDKSSDPDLQTGMCLMGLDGRIIATAGSSLKKTGDLVFSRATDAVLQPGSSIKPVVVYPYAIEKKELYYSSFVNDAPIENYKVVDGVYQSGPDNAYYGYKGNMLLPDAIEISSNGTAAQVMKMIGPENAYDQAVTFMGFTHLNEEDKHTIGGLSIGGLNGGVTVTEMAAAYTYLGNGGLYYEPYTYYYVTDAEDNIILSPQDNVPKQAYSPETAYIMNRLLHYNITYSVNTFAYNARISGWDIVGKTGTTDEDKDSWFCGVSPYGTLAIWAGFDTPQTISSNGKTVPSKNFAKIMGEYLKDKESKEYVKPASIIESYYSPYDGQISSSGSDRYLGYYTEDNLPSYSGAYVDYALYDDRNDYSDDDDSYSDDNYDYGDNSTSNNEYYGSGNSSSSSGEDAGENPDVNSGVDTDNGNSNENNGSSAGGGGSDSGTNNSSSNAGGGDNGGNEGGGSQAGDAGGGNEGTPSSGGEAA